VIAVAHLLRRQVPVFWGLRHTLRLYCLLPLSLPLPECLDPWCLHSLVRQITEDTIGLAMCRDTESSASSRAVCCLLDTARAEELSHARASGCHRSSLHRGLHVQDARPQSSNRIDVCCCRESNLSSSQCDPNCGRLTAHIADEFSAPLHRLHVLHRRPDHRHTPRRTESWRTNDSGRHLARYTSLLQ